jgi:hypothetical protein
MKRALILALASFGWMTAAMAQSPNMTASPGPHDPNPPMNTPDLRLPPPCAPASNLAGAGGVMSPAAATAAPERGRRVLPADSTNVQCSANTRAQTAELPGLAPGVE